MIHSPPLLVQASFPSSDTHSTAADYRKNEGMTLKALRLPFTTSELPSFALHVATVRMSTPALGGISIHAEEVEEVFPFSTKYLGQVPPRLVNVFNNVM
jgi:hypothetical protein